MKFGVKLIVILIAIGVVTCGLSIFHEDACSNTSIRYPVSIMDIGHDGSKYEMDSEIYYVNSLESSYSINLVFNSERYCILDVNFSQYAQSKNMNIQYDFWTEKDSFVPKNSELIAHDGDISTYRYTDGETGAVLLFNIENGLIRNIEFNGMTIMDDGERLHFVQFALNVTYERGLTYIAHYVYRSLPDTVRFSIIGSENGIEKMGNITVTPIINIATYGNNGSIKGHYSVARISIDVDDTSIPSEYIDFYIQYEDAYKNDQKRTILTADNKLMIVDIVDNMINNGHINFSFKGTITEKQLDENCNIIGQTELNFEYAVI